jgi:peptide/nickel transport system substrate-binding protein
MPMHTSFLSSILASSHLSRRDFFGRAAAAGISASAANLMFTQSAFAANPVRGGILRIGLAGGTATDSLDPALASASVPNNIGRTWGEELVELTAGGELRPKLATEWASSKDAKVWTFKIRKGVQFHNGKEMTPDDVVATMERHSGPDTKSGALGIMRGIASVKRSGDAVVFTLKDPNADLPYLLNDFHLLIQPNGGKDNPTAAIGTGPYKMGSYEPGVRYVGARFSNYWAHSVRGFAEQVEFIVLNDTTSRMVALQSGRVHMINRVDPKVVDMIKNVSGVSIQTASGRAHYVMIMQCNGAPFNNPDLRLAMKYATDRKEMVDKILRGYGSVGNDTPINSTYPLYSELPQHQFDPEKAAFHFKKSGYKDAVVLRTSDVAFPGAVDAAQLLQASAAKAGIKVEIKREPGDGYWNEVWNKQPFCMSYWEGRPVQDQMLSTAYISGADWNESKFFNPAFDNMVIAARGELNIVKRKQLYQDMSLMVSNEGGTIVPMFNDTIAAIGPKVKGWVKNPNMEMMGYMAASECWLET